MGNICTAGCTLNETVRAEGEFTILVDEGTDKYLKKEDATLRLEPNFIHIGDINQLPKTPRDNRRDPTPTTVGALTSTKTQFGLNVKELAEDCLDLDSDEEIQRPQTSLRMFSINLEHPGKHQKLKDVEEELKEHDEYLREDDKDIGTRKEIQSETLPKRVLTGLKSYKEHQDRRDDRNADRLLNRKAFSESFQQNFKFVYFMENQDSSSLSESHFINVNQSIDAKCKLNQRFKPRI